MDKPVYVFVDNSNLWIEGKAASGRQSRPSVPSNYYYRIEYGKLLRYILGARTLGDVPRLYGSEPPPNDSIWSMIKSRGYSVSVFKRNIFNKEKGVDMKMGIDITKLTLNIKPPAIIAIVAGDADFLPVVEEAKGNGWIAEVWFWSSAAGDLKRYASRFYKLDLDVDKIGFEEKLSVKPGNRKARK